MNKEWQENVLIKLKRQYSKDDTVRALSKKLSEREIELGKTKSELDEANYKLENLAKSLRKELRYEVANSLNKKFQNKLSKQSALISKLRKEKAELINRFITEKSQNEKSI